MSTPTAEAMARLVDQRARATARVEELESQARAAGQAAAEASTALAEFERKGGSANKRRELEAALAEAKASASQPWHERVEGARAAVRDAQAELQKFQGDNLAELIEALQVEGEVAASKIDAACEELVAAFGERERIAREISLTAMAVGRIRPGDVSATHAEQLVAAARALLEAGGEARPVLRHDPRQPRYGPPLPPAVDEQVHAA